MRYCHLFEKTRKDLLNKQKSEDPEKYKRRLGYTSYVKPLPISRDLFLRDGKLTVPVQVGDYTVVVEIDNVLDRISDYMTENDLDRITRSECYRILKDAFDEEDILVNCTCPDMKYRHAYHATQGDYIWGDPEDRFPEERNPDNVGSVCKHISAVLSNPSQILKYLAGWVATEVNNLMK